MSTHLPASKANWFLFFNTLFPRKSVPVTEHTRLKKQLNELLRRHREYRHILTSADCDQIKSGNVGNVSFGSAHSGHEEKEHFDDSFGFTAMTTVSFIWVNT